MRCSATEASVTEDPRPLRRLSWLETLRSTSTYPFLGAVVTDAASAPASSRPSQSGGRPPPHGQEHLCSRPQVPPPGWAAPEGSHEPDSPCPHRAELAEGALPQDPPPPAGRCLHLSFPAFTLAARAVCTLTGWEGAPGQKDLKPWMSFRRP